MSDFSWRTIMKFDHEVSRDKNFLDRTDATKRQLVNEGKTPEMKANNVTKDGTNFIYYRDWIDEQSAKDWIEFIKTVPNSGLISATYEQIS